MRHLEARIRAGPRVNVPTRSKIRRSCSRFAAPTSAPHRAPRSGSAGDARRAAGHPPADPAPRAGRAAGRREDRRGPPTRARRSPPQLTTPRAGSGRRSPQQRSFIWNPTSTGPKRRRLPERAFPLHEIRPGDRSPPRQPIQARPADRITETPTDYPARFAGTTSPASPPLLSLTSTTDINDHGRRRITMDPGRDFADVTDCRERAGPCRTRLVIEMSSAGMRSLRVVTRWDCGG